MTSDRSAPSPLSAKLEIPRLPRNSQAAKVLYPLMEAAALAKCHPRDLLHDAIQRTITLLVGIPDGVDLRTYDDETKEIGIPFLVQPQLLTLEQSYCLKIELNGRTEQSDFREGYLIDSSGQIKKLLPSYGHPELNHRWATWRTFQGESVRGIELTPERLFVMHSDLVKLIESRGKPDEHPAKDQPQDTIASAQKKQPPTNFHGNTGHNAAKREEILKAAICCKNKWPEQCKTYRAWAACIDDKAPLFWPDQGTPPMCRTEIERLLGKASKLPGKVEK